MRSALLLLSLLFLVACGPTICNGPMIPTPALWLDASAWVAAHPGDRLTACADGACQTLTEADARHPVQLPPPPRTDPAKTMTLLVTDASGLRVQRDFAPVRQTISGACEVSYWKTPADLTADGRLQPG